MGKPKKTILRRIINELERHVNFREGWCDSDPRSNGEYWLMTKVLPASELIIDIGANIGDWTDECLKLNPSARVFAFEASPRTARTFSKRHSGKENVKLFNHGLGESNGSFEFYDYGENAGMSGFFSREETIGRMPEQVIAIQKKSLDSIEELKELSRLDFVKIDTEGAEMDVLRGATGWLQDRRIKLIQFEYNATWIDARFFLADAFALLGKHGYMIGRLCPRKIWWLDGYHCDLETFRYANFVACASEDDARAMGLLS